MSDLLDLGMWFTGALQVQEDLLRMTLETVPNALKLYEAGVATDLALYSGEIAPFWTGALASSPITEQTDEMTIVYLNPEVTNPITGDRPADYGVEQHAMGGWRAFFDRAVIEEGPYALDQGEEEFITRLEVVHG